MSRDLEDSPSKEYDLGTLEVSSISKEYYNIFQRALNKVFSLFFRNLGKALRLLLILAFFNWFNIQNVQLIKGMTELANMELSGFITIANSSPTDSLKEGIRMGTGVDSRWLKYKKETNIDLSKDMVYTGDSVSMTKKPVLTSQMTKDCDIERCKDPATSIDQEEANDFCVKTYGGYLPKYNQLSKVMENNNPFINSRSNRANRYPEITSSLNNDDKDQYRVYFKSKLQYKKLANEAINGLYTKDGTELNARSAFRCFITL